MKRYLIIALVAILCCGCSENIQSENIQVDDVATLMDDAVFIAYCYENFDLNNDGKISMTEANTVRVIEIEDKPKLKSVKGISLFTNLEDISFENDFGLQSIDLSKNTKLTTIGSTAFRNCSSLTSITIPDRVTEIGRYAFDNCRRLKSVYCKPITPPRYVFDGTGWDAFEDNASGRIIYVPYTSVEKYMVADGWNKYSSYIVGYDF